MILWANKRGLLSLGRKRNTYIESLKYMYNSISYTTRYKFKRLQKTIQNIMMNISILQR